MKYDEFRRKYNHIFNKLTNSIIVNSIYEFLIQKGLHYPIYDLLFFRRQFDYERDHPTEEMKASRDYYSKHKEEIKECLSMLSDTKSKIVYKGIIKFRCTRNRSFFPPYDVNSQYFPNEIVKLNDNEVFVDCGACRGDTYRRFLSEIKKRPNIKAYHVICFETDRNNVEFLKRSCSNDHNLSIIAKGVWSTNSTLYYESMGTKGNGHILEHAVNGAEELPVCRIDSVDACKNATYIKMDIEGAEWEALHGAEQIIRHNHPKLAICLYHSDNDYIRLIQYIHELNPEYRLYVRHHSTNTSETVLYAV